MIRQIIQAPDPQLRVVCRAFELNLGIERELAKDVCQNLSDTFEATPKAIGLAAPQIGHSLRAIIVDITRKGTDRYVMCNPQIIKQSPQMQRVHDGCMSVDWGTTFLSTKRPLRIRVGWYETDGSVRFQNFSGLIAACIHHEVDHLDGRLFNDPPDQETL